MSVKIITKNLLLSLLIFCAELLHSQICISPNAGGDDPDVSAALHIKYTNKGLLIPQVALTGTNDGTTISTPATGLLVYNTGSGGLTPAGFYYNAGTPASPNWVRFLVGKEAWLITGNDNTDPSNNFLGTTNDKDLQFRTNNINRMRIMSSSYSSYPTIGIGTIVPVINLDGNSAVLHVHDGGNSVGSQLILSTHSTTAGARAGGLYFAATQVTNNRTTAAIKSYLTAYSGGNASGDLRFFTNNANTVQERMRLYETGQLVLSDNATFPSPSTNYLFTINPTTDNYRSAISIPMSGASSTAYAINVSTANSNSRGYFYENTSGSNGVFYGAGAQLSTTNIASGYLAYRNNSGLTYGLYGINGTNAAYATNANVWAAFIQGRAVISSETSPSSPLGVDLEIRNTTAGSGNPATLSMRQTTSETTSGRILARLNFGDNHTASDAPQAQISVIREAAGGSGDLPTAITFSTTADGSATLSERMRIANNGNVGINTTNPLTKLHIALPGAGEAFRLTCYGSTNPTITMGEESSAPGVGYISLWWASTPVERIKLTARTDLPSYINAGNVGIGTTSPSSKLDVQGGHLTVGTLYGTYVMYGQLGSFDTRNTNPNPETYNIGIVSEFKANTSNGLNDGGSYNSVLSIRQWGSGTDWSGGGVHQIGFTQNGNIWHRYSQTTGSWGPWKKLYDSGMGGIITCSNANYVIKSDGTNGVCSQIYDNGTNVGIGTSSPAVKLHINGDVRGAGGGNSLRINTGNGYVEVGPQNSSWSHFYTDRNQYYFNKRIHIDEGILSSYDENLQLQTQGTTRITILNSNGNVGINTTSPANKLGVIGNIGWGASNEVNLLTTDQGGSIELGGNNSLANPVTNGVPYIDFHFGTGSAQDYNVRLINSANNRLDIATATNGNQLSIHSAGISLSGSYVTKYINFGSTFDASGYGFRDNNGTLEYKHSGGSWTPFAQPPSVPGNVEWWVRPSGSQWIQPMYNANARVYDADQTWAFYYDGTNSKGSFFAGQNVGAIMHRAGVSPSNTPNFIYDQYPFVDVNNDYDITSADNVTYTGGYAYGDAYNGFTGIGALDAGIRGIGLGGTLGTNSNWPVVGVIGEVVATGTSYNGQQGVYGWQAAPPGSAPTCIGTLGRTSQTGNQSAGVAGYYTNTVGNLVTCFSSFQSIGLLGTGNTGAMGQTSIVGGIGVFGVNTDLTSSNNVGVQGQVGNGTSVSYDFKGVVGISNNTNNIYGYGGYFQGEWFGVYAYNPTTSSGYAVYYSGNLSGSGTKSCIMRTSQGPRALYCVESPENWFEDFGTAKLINGRARIDIDPLFLETITIDEENPYKVFIQFIDEIQNGVHIIKHKTFFEVIENNNGNSNATFDWRLVAKRKGYEKLRLKEAPEAYSDPALYTDPDDPSIPEQWRKKVKDHHEFLNNIKNAPIQKYEIPKDPDIDKSEIEKIRKKDDFD